MTKNLRKKIQQIFFFFFCLKLAIYLSPDLHKGRPSHRRSLSTLALLDPDPDCESGSGYGSRDPIESGSTTLITELAIQVRIQNSGTGIQIPVRFCNFIRNTSKYSGGAIWRRLATTSSIGSLVTCPGWDRRILSLFR